MGTCYIEACGRVTNNDYLCNSCMRAYFSRPKEDESISPYEHINRKNAEAKPMNRCAIDLCIKETTNKYLCDECMYECTSARETIKDFVKRKNAEAKPMNKCRIKACGKDTPDEYSIICKQCEDDWIADKSVPGDDTVDNLIARKNAEAKEMNRCAIDACAKETDNVWLCDECMKCCMSEDAGSIRKYIERKNKLSEVVKGTIFDGAVKHDSGKLRLDLIHPAFMEQLGQAMTYGANKYSDDNYLTGEGLTYRRLYASLQRHLLAWYARKDIDPESGLPHLAHAAGALLMLLTSISEGKGKDDRYGK